MPNVWYIPNVQDIPNIPDNPAAGFSAVVPIFPRQKVDHRRLYCASEKLKAIAAAEEWKIYIYIMYIPAVQSRISSAQKQAKAQPNRNTTNHTTGSSFGAICSTQPPANALVSDPNAHNTRTITDYLQPVQTPL